jgi:hypothetical protein
MERSCSGPRRRHVSSRSCAGLRPATDAEFAEHFGELPTDDEG